MNAIELCRVDPSRNMRRFHRLDIQPDLFGGVLLLKQWGRIGARGRIMAERHRGACPCRVQRTRDAEATARVCCRLGARPRRISAPRDERGVTLRRRPRLGGFLAEGFGGPVPWEQVGELRLRHVGDAGEDVGEPGLRIDVVESRGLCRAANYAEPVRFFPRIRGHGHMIGLA